MQHHANILTSENLRLKTAPQDHDNNRKIIGSGSALQQVFALTNKVAATTTTVLILGETDTGKELVAKTIHYHGILKNKPFIDENCEDLIENLLESKLFGHVKGTFTGAISERKACLNCLEGGTIFLDKTGDMAVTMQTKLLRVLQEGQVQPVGGNSYHRVDFRLITTTNRDLQAEIKKATFTKTSFTTSRLFQ